MHTYMYRYAIHTYAHTHAYVYIYIYIYIYVCLFIFVRMLTCVELCFLYTRIRATICLTVSLSAHFLNPPSIHAAVSAGMRLGPRMCCHACFLEFHRARLYSILMVIVCLLTVPGLVTPIKIHDLS